MRRGPTKLTNTSMVPDLDVLDGPALQDGLALVLGRLEGLVEEHGRRIGRTSS